MKPCFLKDPQNQPKEKDQEKHQIVAATKLHPPMLVNQSRNCPFLKFKCILKHEYLCLLSIIYLLTYQNNLSISLLKELICQIETELKEEITQEDYTGHEKQNKEY